MAPIKPHGHVHEFSNGSTAIVCDPPPRGMRLDRATDEELVHYGLPPRPNPRAEPGLHALWQRTFARPLHFVVPEFGEPPEVWQSAFRPSTATVENTPDLSNWSGVAAGLQDNIPVNKAVAADWNVPEVGNDGLCSIWVGIDGYYSKDTNGNYYVTTPESPTNEMSPLLQAGITCFGQADPFYLAWWEWIAPGGAMNPPNPITSLVPYAGYDYSTQIWVTSDRSATLCLFAGNNLTDYASGDFVSLPITAPPATTVWGSSADWIVEVPQMQDGTRYTLPIFEPVEFSSAMGWTASETTLYSGQGTALRATDPIGAHSVGQMVPLDRWDSTVVQCTYSA